MTFWRYLTIIFVSFISTLLDVSFFPFFEVYSSTLLLSLAILVILAILEKRKELVVFASCSVLFYTVFSSVPPLALALLFMGLPAAIIAVKSIVAIDLDNLVWVIIVFFLNSVIFQFVLMLFFWEFSIKSLISLIAFSIINTLFGLMIYFVYKIIVAKVKTGNKL